MYCLVASTNDVYRNLATEEYLLKHCSDDFFLLWQSDNAVVVGKNQDVNAEVNLDYVSRHNIHIARRYSGGGTVYQDIGNFNLTFIESTDIIDFNRYVNRVVDFLSSIGIETQADKRLGITVEGLKISGSAQCVHKHRIMYHCTLLYSTDLFRLEASLNSKPEREPTLLNGMKNVRAVKSVRSQVTNLNNYLPSTHSPEIFKALIQEYFIHENILNNELYQLSPEDESAIEVLRHEKYAKKEWIFKRYETQLQMPHASERQYY